MRFISNLTSIITIIGSRATLLIKLQNAILRSAHLYARKKFLKAFGYFREQMQISCHDIDKSNRYPDLQTRTYYSQRNNYNSFEDRILNWRACSIDEFPALIIDHQIGPCGSRGTSSPSPRLIRTERSLNADSESEPRLKNTLVMFDRSMHRESHGTQSGKLECLRWDS